jgi:hypothetical protein
MESLSFWRPGMGPVFDCLGPRPVCSQTRCRWGTGYRAGASWEDAVGAADAPLDLVASWPRLGNILGGHRQTNGMHRGGGVGRALTVGDGSRGPEGRTSCRFRDQEVSWIEEKRVMGSLRVGVVVAAGTASRCGRECDRRNGDRRVCRLVLKSGW